MRSHSSFYAISLSLLGTGCMPPAPPAQLHTHSASLAENVCAGFDRVDLARIKQEMPEWSRFDELHRQTRRGVPAPAMEGGATILKLAIAGGSIQAPYDLSVWAARQAEGNWRVSHVRRLRLRPPPQPPGMPSLPEPAAVVVKTGRLKPQIARSIDAALTSECLDREPFLSPATLPMKDGTELMCPPDAGGANALEIIQRRGTRRYLRECGRTWASGAIIIALEDSNNLVAD